MGCSPGSVQGEADGEPASQRAQEDGGARAGARARVAPTSPAASACRCLALLLRGGPSFPGLPTGLWFPHFSTLALQGHGEPQDGHLQAQTGGPSRHTAVLCPSLWGGRC